MMTGRQGGDSPANIPPANLPEESGQDMQARIKHLEEWVCALLIKNQTLRMALQSDEPPARSHNYAMSSRVAAEQATGPGLRYVEF